MYVDVEECVNRTSSGGWQALRRHLLEHRIAEELRFAKGTTVWCTVRRTTAFVLLTGGVVKVVGLGCVRDAGFADLLFTGDMGNMPMGDEGQDSATVGVAMAPSRAVVADGGALRRLACQQSEVAMLLALLASRQTSRLRSRMQAMTTNNVSARLAWHLLWLSRRMGLEDARGTFIPLRLTRRDLAGLVGCRVETTIRIVGAWVSEGVLDFLREGVVIFQPGYLLARARGENLGDGGDLVGS